MISVTHLNKKDLIGILAQYFHVPEHAIRTYSNGNDEFLAIITRVVEIHESTSTDQSF